MSLWKLLTLAVLGIYIFHIGSYFAMKMENENSTPQDPVYSLLICFALMGASLSAIAFTKIAREVNESKFK